jgi:RNA polymerase sigma-70 factor (ECF subfamily)
MVTDDLYVACACVAGDEQAAVALTRVYAQQVLSYVARTDPSPAFAEEVRAQLWEELLVGKKDAGPGLVRYSGRAPLGAYLRMATVQKVKYLRRGRRPDVPLEQREHGIAGPTSDAEMQYIKEKYRTAFQAALESAIRALSPDDQTMLRLYFFDGIGIEAIGKVFGCNKSTISRRIAKVREQLLDESKRWFKENLAIEASEFRSLLAVVQSQIAVGDLSSLLGRPP